MEEDEGRKVEVRRKIFFGLQLIFKLFSSYGQISKYFPSALPNGLLTKITGLLERAEEFVLHFPTSSIQLGPLSRQAFIKLIDGRRHGKAPNRISQMGPKQRGNGTE
jgi:hypothetical protein